MRRARRKGLSALALSVILLPSCAQEQAPAGAPSATPVEKTSAGVRAERRAYDGAPPVIPHAPVGVACGSCHDAQGKEVPGLGYAPPSPHEATRGMSAASRCEQCHVYVTTQETFAANTFAGLRQDLRHGERLYAGAPPVIPHGELMRENCAACHTGPSAREEIRCTHPERVRCRQCHALATTEGVFAR